MTEGIVAADGASGTDHVPPKLYVYAIVSSGGYAPTVTGIDGSPLHMVGDADGPRAVVHTHSGALTMALTTMSNGGSLSTATSSRTGGRVPEVYFRCRSM
ncbi:hypothetical protein GCM10009813_06000 [Brevibacterium marinum]|uniref:Uncharacterized protein n=1 Tax=Brevibacterium marinum TaxID=418643 RepID=A0A846RYH6_9MICO|nr:hypothetical protein [Brevibacterium marinum]